MDPMGSNVTDPWTFGCCEVLGAPGRPNCFSTEKQPSLWDGNMLWSMDGMDLALRHSMGGTHRSSNPRKTYTNHIPHPIVQKVQNIRMESGVYTFKICTYTNMINIHHHTIVSMTMKLMGTWLFIIFLTYLQHPNVSFDMHIPRVVPLPSNSCKCKKSWWWLASWEGGQPKIFPVPTC